MIDASNSLSDYMYILLALMASVMGTTQLYPTPTTTMRGPETLREALPVRVPWETG